LSFKEGLSLFYYLLGALAAIIAVIRVLYGWFKDYDNSTQFTQDMAQTHLPHIYKSLARIADKLDVDLEDCPPIMFTTREKH
jgi:hypothetical protein